MLCKQGIVLQFAEDLCSSLVYFHLATLHISVMCLVPGEIEGEDPRLSSGILSAKMGALASETSRGSPRVTQLASCASVQTEPRILSSVPGHPCLFLLFHLWVYSY